VYSSVPPCHDARDTYVRQSRNWAVMEPEPGERDELQLIHTVAAELVERHGADVIAQVRDRIEQARQREDWLSVQVWDDIAVVVALLAADAVMRGETAPRRLARRVPPGKPQATVLIVDDDPDVLDALSRILKRDGYRVIEATGSDQALSVIDEIASIDLLLTDIMMPGLDGFALADRARAQLPDLKILYLTGYAESLYAQPVAGLALGKVLEKPIVPDDLREEVAALVA
jgi:CheY-like chemotaxis protein